MQVRGIIQTTELREDPPESGRIEMIIRVQGVGRDHPRRLVIPMEVLLQDQSLDPEAVCGRGFEADIEVTPRGAWVVTRIRLAPKDLLRRTDD